MLTKQTDILALLLRDHSVRQKNIIDWKLYILPVEDLLNDWQSHISVSSFLKHFWYHYQLQYHSKPTDEKIMASRILLMQLSKILACRMLTECQGKGIQKKCKM